MPFDVVARIVRPLQRPARSSSYPATPPLLAPGVRGLPEVDPGRCRREASCVAVCPTGAIALDEAGWSIDAGRCIFCALCADACPTSAIALGTRVELAARERSALTLSTRLETSTRPETRR